MFNSSLNILKFIIIIINVKLNKSCFPDWFDKCRTNNECCSNVCDNNNGQWIYGLCRPNVTPVKNIATTTKTITDGCKPDWYDKCLKSTDCCSLNCDLRTKWDFGICRPIKTTRKYDHTSFKLNSCKPDWNDTCRKDSDCCSNVCLILNNENKWDTSGICQPKSTTTKKIKTTKKKKSPLSTTATAAASSSATTTTTYPSLTTIQENITKAVLPTCECVCNNNANGVTSYGICRRQEINISTTTTTTTTRFIDPNCKPDWFDRCKTNLECCSGLCDNNNGYWAYGICKPKLTTKYYK